LIGSCIENILALLTNQKITWSDQSPTRLRLQIAGVLGQLP
jgi:hypothetical protein